VRTGDEADDFEISLIAEALQGFDFCQAQQFGELLIDSRCRAVVRGVRTIHRHSGRDQVEEHLAFARVGGNLLHGPKENRVMRDDQIRFPVDRFTGHVGRQSQTG